MYCMCRLRAAGMASSMSATVRAALQGQLLPRSRRAEHVLLCQWTITMLALQCAVSFLRNAEDAQKYDY